MRSIVFAAFAALLIVLSGGLLLTSLAAQDRHEHERDRPAHALATRRTPPEDLDAEEARAVEVYRRALPTVVTIHTKRSRETPSGAATARALGSGVLVSPKRHVLTAAHVVEGATEILVQTQDGSLRPAAVLYSEKSADIALLRLETPDLELPYAKLGDSDHLAVGQRTFVIGSPRGLVNSLTLGHISGFREFGRLYDGTILAEFIQTDAAINSGNSGGPMLNSKGEVIGIASRISTTSGGFEGIGFVVAINTAKELLALEDRPWIGLEGVHLSRRDLTLMFNMDRPGGVLVQDVSKDGPADRAGLRAGTIPSEVGGRELLLGGDLILEFGDQEACHADCVARAGRELAGATKIPVTVLREGKVLRLVVEVAKRPGGLLE